ncbi:MAG: hypothetical protein FWG22_05870 [Prolixibacteraceae bacterium]|nr:hypothetical protein [Prolixibacteraceae bacterium]
MENKYTIEIDFETDRVTSRICDGNRETTAASQEYSRWKKGLYLNEAQKTYRQHPADYIEALEFTVKQAVSGLSALEQENIAEIAVITTASTPVAVDEKGAPLSLTHGFQENPNAMFILWKEQIATIEADEINRHITDSGIADYAGQKYSPSDFWAKVLHTIRADIAVFRAAASWVEHCDWISGALIGNTNPKTMKRSRDAAIQKALWRDSQGGHPSEDFLTALDPMLAGLRQRLFSETCESHETIGKISLLWARKLGLSPYVTVRTGAIRKT